MKKLLLTLTLCVTALVCAFGLTACAHEHSYTQSVINPTCNEMGYTTYTCECGDSYVSDYVEALGHSFTTYASDNNATHTSDGTKTATCDREGCNEKHTVVDLGSKISHNHAKAVTSPTCTKMGYTTYTCECGDSYVSDYVEALGHEFTTYASDNNATHTSDGTKTATCDREGCNEKHTVVDLGSKLQGYIEFKTLTVKDDNTIYQKFPNGTASFSFKEEINVVGNVEYFVSNDIYGSTQYLTKVVPLNAGDNVYYVFVQKGEDDFDVYTVTLRVKPLYNVTFNTQGGSAVDSQMIEEDALVTIPTEPTKTGYTFTGWDFDFATPITSEIVITANAWQANEYDLTFDGNGADNPTGKKVTYDSTYGELPTIERAGGIFNGWYTAKEGGQKIESDTVVKTAIAHTLYARWMFDVKYTLNAQGTEYKVTGLKDISKEDIVIVDNVNGIPVTSIGHSAFYNCRSLTSIEIPSSVTSIGSDAFYYCDSLTSIEIPASVPSIGSSVFYNCDSLTSIEIPASVTSIGSDAFSSCDSLTTVTFGENSKLESIGSSAFFSCDSLTSIEIPSSVTSIDYRTFYYCSSLTSINVHVNNNYYCSEDGVLYNKDKTTLVCYPAGKTQTSFIIPSSVTSIGSWVFYNCSSLTSVAFEDADGWYYTRNHEHNFTGGTAITVTNASQNATYLISTHHYYYWYKVQE